MLALDRVCLWRLQPIVEQANPSIVEPLLNLLRTLHLEVQFEGMRPHCTALLSTPQWGTAD